MTVSRLAGEPEPASIEVPERVHRIAAGAAITPVWRNEAGGITFRLGAETDRGSGSARYLKWAPAGARELDLRAEAERLRWAASWITVPTVLGQGSDETGS